ncbi:MAG TPA: AsmA-like C-terminal domain-containing protein, partial [Sphingomonadales bacterium]|nr:AsmA-like C-terminal domain-containing protein [Sphingomonadales bacterium]
AGKNDLSISARQRTDGILEVVVQAKSLNAGPYIATMFDEAGEPSFAPDMTMTLMAKEAFALNGVVFKNLSIEAEQRQDTWVRANVLGALDTFGAFQLSLAYEKGVRHLKAESDNAGRTALGLNVFRNAQGGTLLLEADLNVFEPRLSATGTLEASDVHMVRSTALIEALAKEEQSGLDPMIRAEGVAFRTLIFPFTLSNGVFDVSSGRANGPSFGFTMEGQIDQKFERMNLNGVVVPAYTLNALLGKIPVIGAIITGGEGKGVISLNYRISGTRENPKVDFNPMSAITPGILRLFVGHKKGTIPPEEEVAPEEEALPDGEEPALSESDGAGVVDSRFRGNDD